MEIDIKEWLNGEGENFLKDIGIKKGDVILDFGCGDGPYAIPDAFGHPSGVPANLQPFGTFPKCFNISITCNFLYKKGF